MNKQALVAHIAAQGNISKAQAERQLDSSLEAIAAGLKADGKVILSGIGRLKTVARKARVGRNPNTGAELQIPAKTVIKFKASSTLVV